MRWWSPLGNLEVPRANGGVPRHHVVRIPMGNVETLRNNVRTSRHSLSSPFIELSKIGEHWVWKLTPYKTVLIVKEYIKTLNNKRELYVYFIKPKFLRSRNTIFLSLNKITRNLQIILYISWFQKLQVFSDISMDNGKLSHSY